MAAVAEIYSNQPRTSKWVVPRVFYPVLNEKHDYYFLWGGRNSGKTYFASRWLVMLAAKYPGLRIACVRQEKTKTNETSRQQVMEAIREFGWSSDFIYSDTGKVKHRLTGSEFLFLGLNKQSGLRSLGSITHCWVDEAQLVESVNFEDFINTIVREQRFVLLLTGNPTRRSDPFYDWSFKRKNRKGSLWIHTTYKDNPFFSDKAREEMEFQKQWSPDIYRNQWLGELLTGGTEDHFLSEQWLYACIRQYEKNKERLGEYTFKRQFGMDPSDGGRDAAILVANSGPFLEHVEELFVERGKLETTVNHVHQTILRFNGRIFSYDEGGIGGRITQWYQDRSMIDIGYELNPIHFGGGVKAEDVRYGITKNKDKFRFLNAQMGWNIRDRAQASFINEEGGNIPIDNCLLIDPSVMSGQDGAPDESTFMDQMTQPIWMIRSGVKIDMDKAPRGLPSPDVWDGICTSYSPDIEGGLVLRNSRY